MPFSKTVPSTIEVVDHRLARGDGHAVVGVVGEGIVGIVDTVAVDVRRRRR